MGTLKKAASGVLAVLPDLRARRLGALRRSRSRTMSTLRASKRLRPCWTNFFERSLSLIIRDSSEAFLSYWSGITQRLIMFSATWALMALIVGLPAFSWAQAVTTYVDRNPITMEETVKLVVKFNGSDPGGAPDLSVLHNNFDVLGTAQSSRTSIINGTMETSTEWVSTLAPKREGSIIIPPIPVGANVSLPLTLKVLPAGQPGKASQSRDLFLDVQVDPKDPYVQSQVTVTVKLYHAVQLREGSLDEPKAPDVLVQKLGEDRSYETVLDGRRYGVIERQYALFPQKSGKITLPPLAFTGKVPDQRRRSPFDDMLGGRARIFGADPFGALRTVRTRSKEMTLTVLPIPSAAKGDTWLPAQEFVLKESWVPEDFTVQAQVGEPITRTITMLAKGLTGTQLPEVPIHDQRNVKIYPDQPKTETRVNEGMAIGIRQQKLAFVPSAPGTLHLPEIRIPWWDSISKQKKTAVLPSRTLTILPENGSRISPLADQPDSESFTPVESTQQIEEGRSKSDQGLAEGSSQGTSPAAVGTWQAIAGVLLILWFGTMIGWWYNHRRAKRQEGRQGRELEKSNNIRQARHAFYQACQTNNPKQAKETLLSWASQKWSANPPLGLNGIAQRWVDPEAKAAVWGLDRVLYAPQETSWDGDEFRKKILPAMDEKSPQNPGSVEGLPPLYLTEVS